MVQSMTAFSRQSKTYSWGTMTIELRSVNQRYLDLNFRFPDNLRALEPAFRNMLRSKLARGKIEISVRGEHSAEADSLVLDEQLASRLLAVCNALGEQAGDRSSIDIVQLAKWPGVIQAADIEAEKIEADACELLSEVIDTFIENRKREGNSIGLMITERLDTIFNQIQVVKEDHPQALVWQREKLSERLAEALQSVDKDRLEQEMVYLANKSDVAEEIDRLHTHIEEVRATLKRNEPIGRRLDFLMQELNREANTLASKSITTKITQASVEIKVLIEQMREQIQNIE